MATPYGTIAMQLTFYGYGSLYNLGPDNSTCRGSKLQLHQGMCDPPDGLLVSPVAHHVYVYNLKYVETYPFQNNEHVPRPYVLRILCVLCVHPHTEI